MGEAVRGWLGQFEPAGEAAAAELLDEIRFVNQAEFTIRRATASIDAGYFSLAIAGSDPVTRDRVYCYELYHQMRSIWPADTDLQRMISDRSKAATDRGIPGLPFAHYCLKPVSSPFDVPTTIYSNHGLMQRKGGRDTSTGQSGCHARCCRAPLLANSRQTDELAAELAEVRLTHCKLPTAIHRVDRGFGLHQARLQNFTNCNDINRKAERAILSADKLIGRLFNQRRARVLHTK